MYQAAGWFAILKNGEVILALFFVELDFNINIDPEVELQQLIHLPAKLVAFKRGHNAHQPCIVEKIFSEVVQVKLQLHDMQVSDLL